MMMKAIGAILILSFVFALGIGTAVAIGRQQPVPARIAALHLTDCQAPCWVGIVPGKTTIGEARSLLQQTYGSIHEFRALNSWGCSCLIFQVEDQGRTIDVQINRDQGPEPPTSIIEDMDLAELITDGQGKFTLADAYFLFGKPDAISGEYEFHRDYPLLVYSRYKMMIAFDMTLGDTAYADLANSADVQFISDVGSIRPSDIHWHGFASYDLTDVFMP